MKAYLTLFRLKINAGLQSRVSAISGLVTQFVWGFMNIIFFSIVNHSSMNQSQLTSYVWLTQAFLSLFAIWVQDNEIFQMIESGGVAYEYVRPYDLYTMWFVRSLSFRYARLFTRALPILVIASLLPIEYRLSLPSSIPIFIFFIMSLVLGSLLNTSISLLMYILTIFTRKSSGVRAIFISIFDLLGGSVIPFPFFPIWLQNILKKTFFFGLQSAPFFIYVGLGSPISTILIQLIWLLILIVFGKILMRKALKGVEVYGG